jgi:hypothetical protein
MRCMQLQLYKGNNIPICVFPVGIDPSKFKEHLKTAAVQERVRDLQEKFAGKKIIIGVDRLDCTLALRHAMCFCWLPMRRSGELGVQTSRDCRRSCKAWSCSSARIPSGSARWC